MLCIYVKRKNFAVITLKVDFIKKGEKMEKIEKINKIIRNIKSDTVVKIEFNGNGHVIKRMELLKIVGMNKTSLKLSDGKTVSKESLFPYYRGDFRREIEYFYLLNVIKNF